MTNVKDAAVAWIAKHVRERWPHEQQAAELSENLDAIASEYEVPLEVLIGWIHLFPPDLEPSTEDFRARAEGYAVERERVLREAAAEEP